MICELILTSVGKQDPNLHVFSVDEKTGMQAIEREQGRAPKSKGFQKRKEYEYVRHGITTLIAGINVENGQIAHYHQGQTRDEQDYCGFIQEMIRPVAELDRVIIIADQLNTHLSESLVKWIARQEEYHPEELGVKGVCGILKDTKSRRRFLETPHHRIRFVFTPKHCSWLNPIENMFAKLQRHLIKNGNFISVEDLEEKIDDYVEFHNRELAKPLKWKFNGFNKKTELK